MLSLSHLIIIFILLFFLIKNVEGFTNKYFPIIPPVGISSKYIEDVKLIKKDFVKEINEIVGEIGGRLKDEDISEYIEYEILKAMIVFEKKNMNNPELFNKDGSWKKEIYDKLIKINREIEKDEEDALENEEERKTLRKIRGDIKNAQIKLWGKLLISMTKKEMDNIYKKSLDSSSSSKLCIGKTLKDDNICKKYDNNKKGCENLINSCLYFPSFDRESLNDRLLYFRDKLNTLEEDKEELINENKETNKISSSLDGDSLKEKLLYLQALKDSDKTLKGCTEKSSWNKNKQKICEGIIKDINNTIKTTKLRKGSRKRYSSPKTLNRYPS